MRLLQTVLLRSMRLRKIKLAGFKSFVEPATLLVPDNLVGIVGPNGCGKSNIIDAVTWVMGESSARHLRGDALTDVIFNGSGARQPIGQASVELVFDNTVGKVGGQYASYNEIAIKRQINRDAVSTYYLNGGRCRRKDIQSLFLGTGLGPRSYAIIEQGMISRLIEARPEELRTFIEEAAGISKFRERRRETENRIRHTRENINRLTDIREEMEKQLAHLQRQAKAAERFQALKREERQLKAELLALDWQALSAQVKEKQGIVGAHENRVEQGIAHLRQIEADIEGQRESYTRATEEFNQAQSDFYQIGSEIAHLEQQIQHNQERVAAFNADITTAREAEHGIERQLDEDKRALAVIIEKARALEPQLSGSRSRSDDAYDALNQSEEAMQSWQNEWDAINQAMSQWHKQIEVDGTRLELLQSGLEESTYRRHNLMKESDELDLADMKARIAGLANSHADTEMSLQAGRRSQEQTLEGLRQSRGELSHINSQLSELRVDYQKNENNIASLKALQYGGAMEDQQALRQWLTSLQLDSAPRLIEDVHVQAGWEAAFEAVAGQYLQHIGVDDLDKVRAAAPTFQSGHVGVLLNNVTDRQYVPKPYPRLLDKVSTPFSLEGILGRVYVAEDLTAAEKLGEILDEDESVVTKDGCWLSNNWIRINRRADEDPGMLSREQSLSTLRRQQGRLALEMKALERAAEDKNKHIDDAEQTLKALQAQLNEQQAMTTSARAQYAEFKTRFEQSELRVGQIADALQELDLQERDDREEVRKLTEQLAQAKATAAKLERQRHRLEGLRAEHKRSLDNARRQWQSTHEHSHEIALQLESLSSQKGAIEQAIKRSDIHRATTQTRIGALQSQIDEQQQPMQALQQSLKGKLTDKALAEARLSAARDNVQLQESALRDKEQSRHGAEQQVQALRAELEEVRLDSQELTVRLQTVEEQLSTTGQVLDSLLQALDKSASKALWQERLKRTAGKIQRLGAINLAAIDEYGQLSERKTYLDSQDADLNEALTTLEGAIRKIDKETRTRFKETFEKLNDHLKECFPALFGGGHAYLKMTGQDLLETGVSIMARPPGKKNSTIHLLSGGEKALTAVALVFSIFKLNPAPFCILDEVDAPLDDNNVGRFSDMVLKMSRDVQFIIITHNKITMEIARHLLGVTMYEAGVSRLVSVDVDEAVEMAATA